MGSPKVSNAKPQLPMENKPVKTPLLLTLKNFFKDKKKEKAKYGKEKAKPQEVIIEKHEEKNNDPNATVNNLLSTFESKLNARVEEKELKRETKVSESEDEFDDFRFKCIEDDRKRHSSEDSGFSDTKEDGKENETSKEREVISISDEAKDGDVKTKDISKGKEDILESFHKLKIVDSKVEKEENPEESSKVVEALEKLTIVDTPKEDRKKKSHEVRIARTPARNKLDYKVQPYSKQQDLDKFRQISQINKHALCGGQVTVNAPTPDTYNEFDIALNQVKNFSQNSINKPEYWQDIQELIDNESQMPKDISDFLQDFKDIEREYMNPVSTPVPVPVSEPNAIEEFTESHNLPHYEDSIDLTSALVSFESVDYSSKLEHTSIFPTPPRSENVPSPMSESQSFYPGNWENSLSPERSSPIYNSDYEKYQEILPQFEDLSPISEEREDKKREGSVSMCSMTMKNFKDMQKEISSEFSKKDCCEINKRSCREIFDEHIGKLEEKERKNVCFRVSKMDLKSAFGVLQHILLNLSTGIDQEDLQYVLFVLICQRVLGQSHALFVGDFGLSLLKLAVMRCPHRPMLTRFIVHYIYAALRLESAAQTQECIFHEVDAQRDNLIIACTRGGDAYALVLAEITRSDVRKDLPPLFRVHHANADGYTALHVACAQHSSASPRLHTLHVLLEHAGADVWKGDVKGGETALHLAVNSVNCDLRVIMMIFKQLDRKVWKKLAHCQNMSSVTPLEYARSATKSTTRQNYPQEVLDFLKKCR